MRSIRKPAYRVKEEETWNDYSDSDEDFEPKPRKSSLKRGTSVLETDKVVDEEYQNKRERNNEAVRKSRAKQRNLRDQAISSMDSMSRERTELESIMGSLSDEIKMLKDVLIGITGGSFPASAFTPSSSPEPDTIDLSNLKYFEFSK
jgi:hypothetical protein